jgi:3-dehydroquinate dehydratase II
MSVQRVQVLNGPNLNLLGVREPYIYGHCKLADIERECSEVARGYGLEILFRQTNAEHEMVEWLHDARQDAGIVINPAAFCYHSIAVREALRLCECPSIEVHISNTHRQEAQWRSKSILTSVCTGMITGLGVQGYSLAIGHIGSLRTRAASELR